MNNGVLLFRVLGFAGVLADAFEIFSHVLDLLKQGIGNIDGSFLGGGQGQAIAGAGVNFDDLAPQLILLLQNQAGEVGRVFQLRDDDPLDGHVQPLENIVDQIVRERAFLDGPLEKHADDRAHAMFDLNDKDLAGIADEDGAAGVGWQDSTNLHWQNVVLHIFIN
jgi:hypothetical protein